ncbi:MAG: phosphoglycolate phosphatase [Gammaproteobacteria bacterium]|nr:phosphoglycolate phosphatase [Gammaproteobacteria bacterium]
MKKFTNIKGVFFDLDGTLFDTAPELSFATNKMLKDIDLQGLESNVIKSFIGKGADNLVRKSISYSSNKNPEVLFKKARKLFDKYYILKAAQSLPYDGVKETLIKLKKKKLSLACVTNKPEIYTHAILKKSGLIAYLDLVVSGDTVSRKKPDPMPLHYSCDKLELEPKEAIMVGDSCNDIEAGFSAGTYVVTVPYGYQYGESIESDKVDLAIENLNDLVTIIN